MWSDMLVKLLPNTKLHKNHPVGAELFHADGWIYRQRGQHDEPNAYFLQFGKFAKGGYFSQEVHHLMPFQEHVRPPFCERTCSVVSRQCYRFKAMWLLCVPPGLTFRSSAWCSHWIYRFCTDLRTKIKFCHI